MNEVMTITTKDETAAVQPITPMAMLQLAVEKGADVDQLTKLMDLHDRWEARDAKRQFDGALASFQANAPDIVKSRDGHNTKYAGLAETLAAIRERMAEHGLSCSWQTDQREGMITVTCRLKHVSGHEETTGLSAAPDGSGNKNSIQAIGSTVTYLERYTLFAALGLASKDQDDDGRKGAGPETISAEQKQQIIDKMREVGADTAKFLAYLQVGSLDDIHAVYFKDVMAALEKKRGGK